MSGIIYEAEIGNYYFTMINSNTIEVWGDKDAEHPCGFIYLKEGAVKTEKDFHYEISDYFMKNCERVG